jgi:hypothetical protein
MPWSKGNPHLRPEPPADDGRSGLTAWYRRHASHLVEVLTSTATDAPVRMLGTDVSGAAVIGAGEPIMLQDRAETLLRVLWNRADLDVPVSDPQTRTLLSGAITP